MSESISRGGGRPGFGWILAVGAFIGLQFGLYESLQLRQSGFALPGGALVEIAVGHLLVGAVLGLLVALAAALLARVLPDRSATWVAWAGLGGVLLVFAVVSVNVRFLRGALRPQSLLVDLVILLAISALVWIVGRRPWSRRAVVGLLVAVLVVDVAVAMAAVRPESESPAVVAEFDRNAGEAPNIIVILLDTLRPDHMGIYGYHRDTTPRIDEFAEGATVFERAYSASNWTRPAIASLHSSTLPSRHGMISLDRGLPPSLLLMAQRLKGSGYQTGFFTVGVNIEPEDGYSRGVDHFYFAKSRAALERTPMFSRVVFSLWDDGRGLVREDSDGSGPDSINERVLGWEADIDRHRPAFFYIHYMGPHAPYSPKEPWASAFTDTPYQRHLSHPPALMAGPDALSAADKAQMIAQYDGETLLHDEFVAQLLDELGERGRLDDAVVVITADHGEGWGEHGIWEHGRGLFEEIVRIPLIVWSSRDWNRGQRLEVPASLVDLAPTLLDAAELELPEGWDGMSLMPWVLGENEGVDRIVFQENGIHAERGLRDGEWAYFEGEVDGELMQWLYAADDRLQLENLAQRYQIQVDEFHDLVAERSELDASRGDTGVELEMDEARLERLRSLGYTDN